MKYKLIKEYPGSPRLGVIIDQHSNISNLSFSNLSLACISNYPKFWEPVVEKDYEILSLISTTIEKTIITYENGGECYKNDFLIHAYKSKDYWIKCFTMNNNPWKIHSIKRLSNGEIFTIGDKVEMFKGVANIKTFRILSNGEFVIDFDNKCAIIGVENISKLKQPLFVTEDGVDISEGDDYWVYDYGELKGTTNKIHKVNRASQTHTGNGVDRKYFSTKEKAEEYIIMNKPCLSLNDYYSLFNEDIRDYGVGEKLRKLVKSKIQQSV